MVRNFPKFRSPHKVVLGPFPFDPYFLNHGSEISGENFLENLEIVEISRSEPLNRKFWKLRDKNRMEQKFPGNWVYPTRLSSFFSEILIIRVLLFSASFFERDHSELNISRKDDGDAYPKMETLKNHYVDKC